MPALKDYKEVQTGDSDRTPSERKSCNINDEAHRAKVHRFYSHEEQMEKEARDRELQLILAYAKKLPW